VVDTATNQVILNAGLTVNGVRPFTVNGTNTLMFTASTTTSGFQVLSLTGGNVLYTVTFSGSCVWTASNAPSHGISLSPDEKRVYVMDAPIRTNLSMDEAKSGSICDDIKDHSDISSRRSLHHDERITSGTFPETHPRRASRRARA
jgi:hypothetical protein